MKRLVILLLAMVAHLSATAQVITISSDFFKKPESEVKIKLVDSITQQPLQLATVYLQPKGDTTIMYFSLSDTSGTAVLENVVRGSYKLTAEFLGYSPVVREYYFNKTKEDLGTVAMVEDAVLLEAATVSAIGNPIEVVKDTIVYNATMFRTADNAVLGELLKKMPGFEVSSSGQVKVNGEEVSKITVNGKTFFFEDPSMAVKNLPAKIVDKIKITDYKSDQEKATGIANMGSRQKEMDIALKKEYEKGWFGNAKLAAGTPVTATNNSNQPLIAQRDVLYNGSVMVSGYNEKDQITIIGNAYNVENIGANDYIIVSYGGAGGQGSGTRPTDGVSTNRQAGVNFNTSRIKGFTTSAVVNYKGDMIDSESITNRTTMQENAPSVYSNTDYKTNYDENALNASLEFANKDKKKYNLRIYPTFNYKSVKQDSYKDVQTSNIMDPASSALGLLNQSQASDYLESDQFEQKTQFYFAKPNFGKANRSLSVSANYSLNYMDAQKKEFSSIMYSNQGTTDIKDLYYKNKQDGGNFGASITYVEPIGENWRISTMLSSRYRMSNLVSDAYRYTGANNSFVPNFSNKNDYTQYDDYYSSVSQNKYFRNSAQLLAQYIKGSTTVQFGADAEVVNNETYSKTYGLSQTTGKGEYLWNWSPYVRIKLVDKKGASYNLNYSGSSNSLSNSQLSPVPDISNPAYITMGNIYLQPQFNHFLNLFSSYRNKKNFSFLSGSIFMERTTNSIVNANWFDADGVQYNIPVNSKKGSLNGIIHLSLYNLPLNKERSLTFSMGGNVQYGRSFSYQSVSGNITMDMDNFDYSKFMSEFWGSSNGDLFYSGKSGFKESRTTTTSFYLSPEFEYKSNLVNCSLGGSVTNNRMSYSLNKKANVNTWDYSIDGEIQVETKNKYTFITTLNYSFYRGYAQGYGKPSLLWNFEAHKSIKSVTLSIRFNDILNQTTNFRHTTTANYVEDSYKKIIGRRILVGITFNFGKMNTAKNSAANRSMLNMML